MPGELSTPPLTPCPQAFRSPRRRRHRMRSKKRDRQETLAEPWGGDKHPHRHGEPKHGVQEATKRELEANVHCVILPPARSEHLPDGPPERPARSRQAAVSMTRSARAISPPKPAECAAFDRLADRRAGPDTSAGPPGGSDHGPKSCNLPRILFAQRRLAWPNGGIPAYSLDGTAPRSGAGRIVVAAPRAARCQKRCYESNARAMSSVNNIGKRRRLAPVAQPDRAADF